MPMHLINMKTITHHYNSSQSLFTKLFTALFLCAITLCAQAQTKAFKVEVTGKGQPIILIPGYSCSGDVWKETVAHLQGRYECHVLTIAGYAGVPAVDTPMLATVKNELIRYVQQKKLVKPIIIGHSLGSFMGLWVSSTAPQLFGKLVCVDGMPFLSSLSDPNANADSLKKNPMYNAEAVARNFERLPDSGFIDNTARALRSQVNDTARARQIATWQYLSNRRSLGYSIVELATTDLRQAIAHITSPVLVLGSIYQTKERSMELIQQQFKHLPTATIRVADSKHFIMYDVPDWFYKELDAFLQ
ncbi:MAG: alpha/beta hydrolase [Chitinophagaceae bacterium]|nr:MAG: alpha/beta hydrolase [Chitinophagaceae bacterium]